ncbi:MAG: DNA-binding response regulator, partial [Lysobacterales bacterium CG02_land_8_20_14_3_00_62_12]
MALPILLAEDDPITREALSVHLLQLGFQVLACSGFQAA